MPRHEFEHSVSQKDNRGKHVRRRPNLSSKMQASDNNISRPLSATGIRTTCTSSRENYDDIEALLPIPRLTFVYSSMLIVMFTLVSYWTCVHGDFVFDDSEAILNNRDVGGNISVSQIFFHDFWGTDVTSNLSHKSYRPLTTLTFKLNYYIAGGMYPWGFHFFNIAVHVAVCMLLLLVFDAFFGTLDGHCRISFQLKFPRACLFSVLFFTVHPVHTECVSCLVLLIN